MAAALHHWALEAKHACGGRVARAETIHLTLAFLGEVDEGALPLLKGLQVKGEKHSLPIDQARYWKHNRIVWAGPLELPSPMERLAQSLAQALRGKDFETEKRRFAAHVTLIRNAHAPEVLPPLPRVRWPVEEVVLVESRPAGAGRSYEVLARYALS